MSDLCGTIVGVTAYTTAQEAAIGCVDSHLQIIACAGSGKTEVISQRVAELLRQPGVEPRNIVAFTFTEKAAAELKDRILARVAGGGGSAVGLAEMFVGTMHAFALDLLQTHVPDTFKFGVLTDITARLLIDRNSRKSGLTECPTTAEKVPVLRRYLHSGLYQQVTSVLREGDVDWESVPEGVQAAYLSYLQLLGEHAYLDYTQMILWVVELLEADDSDDPAAAQIDDHVRSTLRYLVVDEYQDVNPLQERLIRGLAKHGANVCVVGDDDQTIYQWRGSEVGNILTFAGRYPGVRQVTLAENFRSSTGIVDLGRSIAERLPAASRLPKDMSAAGHQQWHRGDTLALTFDSPEEEATWICDRIQRLIGTGFRDAPDTAPRGLSWSDFAVLFRSVAKDAGPLVAELRNRGIPYVVKGLNRLFESPEIQAVVGIFDYMVDRIDADGLRQLWSDAALSSGDEEWRQGLRVLDVGRDFTRGEQWGVYNIQRLYLDFLEAIGMREDTVRGPVGRGELVFYQLGKFSQVISDFEEINFSSDPGRKYLAFAEWLRYQAPDYYAESDADVGYAAPDAVTITTVHQAKGMQWPAVFLPCLRRNRFPSQRHGGLGLFHVVPPEAVRDPDRYRGTVEDETRLFYVAATRAQKYLAVTFSPGTSSRYRRPSEFFNHCAAQVWMSTKESILPDDGVRLAPTPRRETPQVTLSFSELKYYFECPYQFKLRFLYGFNPPIHEALGYGKGLHNVLAEVHKRALRGDLLDASVAEELVDRHLHTPYAYPELERNLRRAAIAAVGRYFDEHGAELPNTIHSEKQIEVHLGEGILVSGRIDLIRRLDTDELSIVDFKSSERAQAEDVTRDQLHVYALGYQELSGERADLIEVLNLDEAGKTVREAVEDPLLGTVRSKITEAGNALRTNVLPRHTHWCSHCANCDLSALCRRKP